MPSNFYTIQANTMNKDQGKVQAGYGDAKENAKDKINKAINKL